MHTLTFNIESSVFIHVFKIYKSNGDSTKHLSLFYCSFKNMYKFLLKLWQFLFMDNRWLCQIDAYLCYTLLHLSAISESVYVNMNYENVSIFSTFKIMMNILYKCPF